MRLPHFIVAGAQKCGTTSLHHYLSDHPALYLPRRPQELHFFDLDRNFERGLNWYGTHFAHAPRGALIGQTSPLYIYDSRCAQRIYEALPSAKLLFVLRNPVDRAYSHYWHQVKKGSETLTFEEAIDREPERMASCYSAKRSFSYLDRGHYAEQLERFLMFFPHEQLKVVFSEDLKKEPKAVLSSCFTFLGVPDLSQHVSLDREHNVSRLPRSQRLQQLVGRYRGRLGRAAAVVDRLNLKAAKYPPMNAQTRTRLEQLFAPENTRLAEILNLNIVPWSPGNVRSHAHVENDGPRRNGRDKRAHYVAPPHRGDMPGTPSVYRLPDFVCIGTYKAATTWLFDVLSEHPGVFLPDIKEIHFFNPRAGTDAFRELGLNWYSGLYAKAKEGALLGDITPGYLADELAPARIKETIPDTKLIVMLRDPVARVHSHYYYRKGMSRVEYSLDDAIERWSGQGTDLVGQGLYARHLGRYRDLFADDQMRVFLLEDVKADPVGTFEEVCRFIGADPSARPPSLTQRSNVARTMKSRALYRAKHDVARWLATTGRDNVRQALKATGLPALINRVNSTRVKNPPLTSKQRARLVKIYREDIKNLEEMLGRDLSSWRS